MLILKAEIRMKYIVLFHTILLRLTDLDRTRLNLLAI